MFKTKLEIRSLWAKNCMAKADKQNWSEIKNILWPLRVRSDQNVSFVGEIEGILRFLRSFIVWKGGNRGLVSFSHLFSLFPSLPPFPPPAFCKSTPYHTLWEYIAAIFEFVRFISYVTCNRESDGESETILCSHVLFLTWLVAAWPKIYHCTIFGLLLDNSLTSALLAVQKTLNLTRAALSPLKAIVLVNLKHFFPPSIFWKMQHSHSRYQRTTSNLIRINLKSTLRFSNQWPLEGVMYINLW